MARHLVGAGHRRLAYVDTGVEADFRAHERGKAFIAAARASSATAQALTARPGDAFDAGRAALHAFLDKRGRPQVDAIAFANDHLACGAMLEAEHLGIQVPAQVALMGFGDFPLSRQLSVGLSSVHPPRYEIGRETAATMLGLLEDKTASRLAASRAVDCQLVQRGSTAPSPTRAAGEPRAAGRRRA